MIGQLIFGIVLTAVGITGFILVRRLRAIDGSGKP
jgi:hypothetical protein